MRGESHENRTFWLTTKKSGWLTALKDKILGTHVRMDMGIAGSDFDNQEMHRSYPIGLPSPHDDATLLHRYCYRNNIA